MLGATRAPSVGAFVSFHARTDEDVGRVNVVVPFGVFVFVKM